MSASACAGAPGLSVTLRDTTAYECTIYGGQFARLFVGTEFVDSVDLFFGVHDVPHGLLFQPVRTFDDGPPVGRITCAESPVRPSGTSREPLDRILPLFNTEFPAAELVDAALYYWGFALGDLYAMRHDFHSRQTDTTFLASNIPATDNRYAFHRPEIGTDFVTYAFEGSTPYRRIFLLDRTSMLVVQDSGATRQPSNTYEATGVK